MSLQVPGAGGRSDIARSTTVSRKKAEKVTLETIKQGIKQLYPPEGSKISTKIDVVFVPGLGANPEESWKSTRTDFNWACDKDGLQKETPDARVLLYQYESAFHGQFKVEQFIGNCAKPLLYGLQAHRGEHHHRPLVFIGHSMGGLVIAKAITIMNSQASEFPKMLEATAGCIFFGSPFNGASAASVAGMVANVAEKFGGATQSQLLELMKPGDTNLEELRTEFFRLATKGPHGMEIFSFWEEHDTDIAKMASDIVTKMGGRRIGSVFYETLKKATGSFKIVTRESATCGGVIQHFGLACNHRDLVKFDSFKDSRYSLVRAPLKKIIHGAPLVAKKRLSTIEIDPEVVKVIHKSLEPTSSSLSRKRVSQLFSPSSWLPTDTEFLGWLSKEEDPHDGGKKRRGDCLFIVGAQGRGKTGAAVAALAEIEKAVKADKHKVDGKAPILLVYYFCDPGSDSTAEDLLKSILLQLVQEQPMFLPYAKQFARESRSAPTSVENLWQSLQDMLSDSSASSRVYFVINNIHGLPQDSESTRKLLELIKADVTVMDEDTAAGVSVRWMFTSRKVNKRISDILDLTQVRVIDLEDEKYADQVQLELRKHAQRRVLQLGAEKGYKKDLAYFISSLLGKRAESTSWIDMTCGQLDELPKTVDPLQVRQTLKRLPQHLDKLLDGSWQQVFDANKAQAEKIKDMLQALILTYEDPTIAELAILAGFIDEEETNEEKELAYTELKELIGKCTSFLALKGGDTSFNAKVYFKSPILKPHLLRRAQALLGASPEELKWLHGEMALRSFSHVVARFSVPGEDEQAIAEDAEHGDGTPELAVSAEDETEQDQTNEDSSPPEEAASEGGNSDNNAGDEDGDNDDENNDDEDDNDDEEEEEEEEEEDDDTSSEFSTVEPEVTGLPYLVTHWLDHASQSTIEIAEDLSLETAFWERDSPIRRRWLEHYDYLTRKFDVFTVGDFKALHVAASIGFRHLVAALVKNGHESEINEHDSEELVNTPLHFAAYYGQPEIVEELVMRGARVDDGDDTEDQTPLSMAAQTGAIKVMQTLMGAGADANTTSSELGTPLCLAIGSGNLEAVKVLIDQGALISPEPDDRFPPPLTWAAYRPDSTIFDYLMEQGKDTLTTHDYDSALIGASYYGNIEVLTKLLDYEHSQEQCQEALRQATDEAEWEIVKKLLEKYPGLDCNNLFQTLATCYDDQDEFLNAVWEYAGGSISAKTLNDSVYHASDEEKNSTVKYLLETCKADPNSTGDDFGNALTAAAYDGNLELVTLLLDAGADVNSSNGWALQTAAGEGHEEIVALLIERGADVNACSDRFEPGTALQAACGSGIVDIVETLLKHKANPDLGAGYLTCPIIAAARKGEPRILELLVKAGAKVNLFGGPDMSSPLINAAIYLPKESLELLIDQGGADINLPDNDGDTALIMAALRGDHESVEFLLKYGADVRAVSSMRGMNALQAAFCEGDRTCIELLINHVSELLKPPQETAEATGADEKEVVPDTTEENSATHTEEEKHEESRKLDQQEETKEKVSDLAVVQSIVSPPVDSGHGSSPYRTSVYGANAYEGSSYGGSSYATSAYAMTQQSSGPVYGMNPPESTHASNRQSYATNAYNAYSYEGNPGAQGAASQYGTGQHVPITPSQTYTSPPPETSPPVHTGNTTPHIYASPLSEKNTQINEGSPHVYGDSNPGPQSYAPSLPGSGLRRSSARASSYGFGAIAGQTDSPSQPYGLGTPPTSPPNQPFETHTTPTSLPNQPYFTDSTSAQEYGAPNPHRASSYGSTGYNPYGVQRYNPNGYQGPPQEQQYGGGTPPTLRVGYGAQPPPITRKPVPGQGGYSSAASFN